MSEPLTPILRACAVLGGQAEMARLLGITPAAVNQWCKGLREVPAERCPDIEQATRALKDVVLCDELRPDIPWKFVRESGKTPSTTAEQG